MKNVQNNSLDKNAGVRTQDICREKKHGNNLIVHVEMAKWKDCISINV